MMGKLEAVLNMSGKTMLGIYSLSMLLFCYVSLFGKIKIPAEIIAIYGMVLGAYAASKTIMSISDGQKNV